MAILTLTPESWAYGTAISLVGGLGCSSVSAHLRRRWFGSPRLSYLAVHAAVASIFAACGLVCLRGWWLLGVSTEFGALSIAVGGLAGWGLTRADRLIVRLIARRPLRSASVARRVGAGGPRMRQRPIPQRHRVVTPTGRSALVRRVGGGPGRSASQPGGFESGAARPVLLTLTAVAEEIVFRCNLLYACLLLPDLYLSAAAVAGTSAVFALSHVFFGWPHVVAKLPLGFGCCLLTLAIGNVWAAIAAHSVFNLLLWKDEAGAPVLLGGPGQGHPSARPGHLSS